MTGNVIWNVWYLYKLSSVGNSLINSLAIHEWGLSCEDCAFRFLFILATCDNTWTLIVHSASTWNNRCDKLISVCTWNVKINLKIWNATLQYLLDYAIRVSKYSQYEEKSSISKYKTFFLLILICFCHYINACTRDDKRFIS